jgi:hypothetical protein
MAKEENALNKAKKAELSAFSCKKARRKDRRESLSKKYCKKEEIMVFYR